MYQSVGRYNYTLINVYLLLLLPNLLTLLCYMCVIYLYWNGHGDRYSTRKSRTINIFAWIKANKKINIVFPVWVNWPFECKVCWHPWSKCYFNSPILRELRAESSSFRTMRTAQTVMRLRVHWHIDTYEDLHSLKVRNVEERRYIG